MKMVILTIRIRMAERKNMKEIEKVNKSKEKNRTKTQDDDHKRKGAHQRLTHVPFSPLRQPSPKPKSSPKIDRKRKTIDVKSEYAKRVQNEKEKIRLVVVGHVDAGKSTLMGHLLYAVGRVDARTMHKYEKDSQKVGKGSFAFAWVLDETGEERERYVICLSCACVLGVCFL